MELKYWTNFAKRINSTKVPTGQPNTVNVVLKEDTSIEKPSIILSGNSLSIDYCRIDAFGKYYFVDEPIMLTNGLTQYDLIEDTLATHKSTIGSTVAHVVYSSTGYDKYLTDPRLAVKSTKHKYTQTGTTNFNSTGCYVVSVINTQSNGIAGAAAYYLLDATELSDLMSDLCDSSVKTQIEQIFTGDWMQLVVSCIWLPLSYSTILSLATGGGGTAGPIAIGNVLLTNVLAVPITVPVIDLSNVSLVKPFSHQDFRDGQPYTSGFLYLPGLGNVDININDFLESSTVNVATTIDVTTGDIIYKIYDDQGIVMQTLAFNGGFSVPLAHITTNAAGALTSIGGMAAGTVGLAASIATVNPVGYASSLIGMLAGASSAAMQFNSRSTSIKGTNAGRSSFKITVITLTLVVMDTEDPDDANYIARWGRPVGITHAISNHSGFIQCEGASMEIIGDNFERAELNNFLNNGFYYE